MTGLKPQRRPLLLHVGYGKTGTSTLQRAVFDPLCEAGHIHYFGMFLTEPRDHPDRLFFAALQRAMYLDDAGFEAALGDLRRDFASACARSRPDVPMVLSNEHFLLSSYSSRERGVKIAAPRTAQRLGRVFEGVDVKLLAGIRRQDRFLYSIFIENLTRPEHANMEHYIDIDQFISRALDPADVFHSMLEYDRCIAYYQAAFNAPPTFLYLFEDFVEDQAAVSRGISGFLDLEPGLSMPERLPDHNAKRKTDGGVVVSASPPLVRHLARLPGGRALVQSMQNIEAMRSLRDAVRPKRTVPMLSDDQSALIRQGFYASNGRLAARSPEIRRGLIEHGYCRDPQ